MLVVEPPLDELLPLLVLPELLPPVPPESPPPVFPPSEEPPVAVNALASVAVHVAPASPENLIT
ncbi:hypothetical protein D3C74_389630 [compost metagenome]